MPKKILVVMGHHRRESYCNALADAYENGAREAGADIERLNVVDLEFDPILREVKAYKQPLEPDLERAQQLIQWADHLVFVYPLWWGSMPTLLKGFLDRTLMLGFGYQFHNNGFFWEKLLKGRTSHVIMTMDTPPAVFRCLFGDAGIRLFHKQIMGFCGIGPNRATRIGMVRRFSEKQRHAWLEKVNRMGRQFK